LIALAVLAPNGRASATDALMPAPTCYDCDAPKNYIRPHVTLVNFVVHKYRVIEAPELVPAHEAAPHRHRSCKNGDYNRYDCRPLRARY
jgi:hypothetical protein